VHGLGQGTPHLFHDRRVLAVCQGAGLPVAEPRDIVRVPAECLCLGPANKRKSTQGKNVSSARARNGAKPFFLGRVGVGIHWKEGYERHDGNIVSLPVHTGFTSPTVMWWNGDTVPFPGIPRRRTSKMFHAVSSSSSSSSSGRVAVDSSASESEVARIGISL
jgi:hypothetical protein